MTCATVNKELKDKGIDVKMYKGNGYYYFVGGPEVPNGTGIESLYSMTLKSYTLAEIVEHVQNHINNNL